MIRLPRIPGQARAARTSAALLALPCSSPAWSQEHHGEASARHASVHHDENMVGIFVGGATEQRRDKGPALGLEYERRISAAFGIGVLDEHMFGSFVTTVYAVPFAYHSGRWKTYIAPGIEDGEEGPESMLRLGIEYGFEAGEWKISPQFDLDFVAGDAVAVLGVVFALGFWPRPGSPAVRTSSPATSWQCSRCWWHRSVGR